MEPIAVSVAGPNSLSLISGERPEPLPGEIKLRVRRAGICGSDMHILHGSNPFARYPRIIGHEFAAGEIVAIGEASSLAVGDHVVADPVVACGHCYPCRRGRPNVCAHLEVIGVHRDGGFSSYAVLPEKNAIKVSPNLSLAVAALSEPPRSLANVLTGTGCDEQDTVLVYGAGTVGITVLQVTKLKGARCIVVDIDEARLERAREFGADLTIHSPSTPVAEAVKTEMDGLGPSVVIDGAGVPCCPEEACHVASPAGRIGLLGFSSAPCNISQQDIVRKELSLFGSR